MPDEDPCNPPSLISKEDYEDYEFILADLRRNIELSPRQQIDRIQADPWAAFSGLKAANGFDLPLSRAAQQRFTTIAARGLKQLGTGAQIHRLKKVVEALKSELSSMLQSGFVPAMEDAHDVFVAAVGKLEGEYAELTYHVPCSVVAEQSYSEFAIGPVTFVLREQFLKRNEFAVQQGAAGFRGASDIMLARTHAFYSRFQWVASITVPPCDAEVSRRRAHAAVQKALDVFKLLVGNQRASHVKQAYGHAPTTPSEYAELVSCSTGSFSLHFGGKLQDAVLNDHWYEQVTAGPAWPFFQCVLTNYCSAWDHLDEIQTRFLDGLSWHSDAISESDSGAKIMKFWTSIERTLRALPGDIEIRAAVLSSNTAQEFAKYSQKFGEAYKKRRNYVVHGNANRAGESWYDEAVAASEEASKNVLFQYLYSIPQILDRPEATDRGKIRAWLKGLDNLAAQYRSQLRSK